MSSLKIDKYIQKGDLPAFFRQLADALEKGEDGILDCASDFKKLKIKARDEYGQISLRVRVKSASECRDEDIDEMDAQEVSGAAKPKYKVLKKRMALSFSVIFKMIHQGDMPPKQAVDEFLADSRLMVTYPGYGDPHYDEYIAACDAFAEAFAAGDMARLNETVDVLVHQKGHCHAEYK